MGAGDHGPVEAAPPHGDVADREGLAEDPGGVVLGLGEGAWRPGRPLPKRVVLRGCCVAGASVVRMRDGKGLLDREAWERLTGAWEGYLVALAVFGLGGFIGLAVEAVLLWSGAYPGVTGWPP